MASMSDVYEITESALNDLCDGDTWCDEEGFGCISLDHVFGQDYYVIERETDEDSIVKYFIHGVFATCYLDDALFYMAEREVNPFQNGCKYSFEIWHVYYEEVEHYTDSQTYTVRYLNPSYEIDEEYAFDEQEAIEMLRNRWIIFRNWYNRQPSENQLLHLSYWKSSFYAKEESVIGVVS